MSVFTPQDLEWLAELDTGTDISERVVALKRAFDLLSHAGRCEEAEVIDDMLTEYRHVRDMRSAQLNDPYADKTLRPGLNKPTEDTTDV